MTDQRSTYIEGILKAFKAGDIGMAEAVKAIRKRKPNQAKVDGAKEFAQLIMQGKVEEAFAKYRFGLKDVRPRRRKASAAS